MSDQKNLLYKNCVQSLKYFLLYDMTYNASCEKNSMSERRIYV